MALMATRDNVLVLCPLSSKAFSLGKPVVLL